jgi:hypothetical protein
VLSLIKAIETKDVTLFADACDEYHSICTLDRWKFSVLAKIKKRLTDEIEQNDDVL